MSILESLEPFTARDGTVRFTPGTITLLTQDPQTKELAAAAILVSTPNAGPPRVYGSNDAAWLWALQAAKTSITVWGIWLGHVYHLHIVTAAMQMTMYNHLPADHPLRPLLEPQSQSLIDFDFVLLTTLFQKISPPTPVSGPLALLTLARHGSPRTARSSTTTRTPSSRSAGSRPRTSRRSKDWDRYPLVGWLLEIWQITHEYVKAVVEVIYPTDSDVANDAELKAWMDASGDPLQGNIKGLPDVKTRDDLTKVLTSLLYRVNAHGGGTLTPSVHPALGFVANFPPCLQSADIPEPGTPVPDLLARLPHTGTCGGMTTFFYTFVYSPAVRAADPERGHQGGPLLPAVAEPVQRGAVQVQTGHPRLRRHVRRGLERGACVVPRGPTGSGAVVCRESIRAVVPQHRALNRSPIGAAGIEPAASFPRCETGGR